MIRRTTVELDEALLARSKKALNIKTTRGVIEEALRLASDNAERTRSERSDNQKDYLDRLAARIDTKLLADGEMWR